MAWERIDGRRTIEFGAPGEMRQRLTHLVRSGAKTATAGLQRDYLDDDEPLEHVGEQLVMVDDDGAAIGVIVIDRVEVVPFAQVTWDFAEAEGEGFTSVADWAEQHCRFWSRQGTTIEDTTEVVCLWFALA